MWDSAVWGQGAWAGTLTQVWRRGGELLGRGRDGLAGSPACASVTWTRPPTASVAPTSLRGHGPVFPQGNGVIRASPPRWAAHRVRRQRHGWSERQRGAGSVAYRGRLDGMSGGEKSRMGCLAPGSLI